jgi:hypothetical protein
MFLNDCSFVISYTSRIPAGVATDRLDGTDKDLDGVGRAAMDRDILIRLSESTHSVAVVCGRDGLEALLSCSLEIFFWSSSIVLNLKSIPMVGVQFMSAESVIRLAEIIRTGPS